MSDRSALVLRLAALPARDPARDALHGQLVSDAVRPDVVAAKFRDYARRGFLTSDDWQAATLTGRGQQMLERVGAS